MPSSGAIAITLPNVEERPQFSSLDAFLAASERRALRIAEITTRDRDEALDVVQDAMLKLARHYATRPSAEWPALFHRILQNALRDWQRRRAVQRRVFFWREHAAAEDENEDFLESLPDVGQPGADARLMQGEAMQRLESALRALPARQREAFELRLWQGLDVAQTARAMGCSEGSVKTHLFRALAALRGALEDVWT